MATTEHPDVSPSPTTEGTLPPTTLATTDIVVLVIYFLLVLAVGLWVSLLKRQNAVLYHFTVTKYYSSKCVTYHIYGLTSFIWHIHKTFAHPTVHVEDQEEHSGWIFSCWQKHDLVAGKRVKKAMNHLHDNDVQICPLHF